MSCTTQNDGTNRTLTERIRELNKFQGCISSRTGKSLQDKLALNGGKEVVSDMVLRYLFNFRNTDGKNHKCSFLPMLRSSIKIKLIEAYGLDISKREHFQDRWLEIISELYADGMAFKECGKRFEDIISLKTHLENHSQNVRNRVFKNMEIKATYENSCQSRPGRNLSHI